MPKVECQDLNRRSCSEVPVQDCQQKPRRVCSLIPSIETKEVSDRQCTTAQRNVCQPISKQVCNDVNEPRQVCNDVPGHYDGYAGLPQLTTNTELGKPQSSMCLANIYLLVH